MNSLDEYTSLSAELEKLVVCEGESIAVLERTIHELGDTVVTSLLHQLVIEKQHHRLLLEHALEDVNEQLELDEAII